ncbi:MAG TPA: DUF4097 family beta strand repeat-containing protein, partial [Polyangiaceae bacterium]|nr:DUF4097 family beta strand repeat-containing protein [Polyangiaceae bacterium]
MARTFEKFPIFIATTLLLFACAAPDTHTEHAVIDEPVTSVTVNVRSGDIHLRGADVGTVSATARIEGDANHLGHALTGGKLSLVDDCHENHCSVDIDVTLPAGVEVEIEAGSGDLALEGLLGSVQVHTSSGDIVGHDLSGAALSAETGSGDVALEIGEPAENIRVEAGSGDIALGVPAGSYRLRAATSSGDRRVERVVDDPDASASIDATTSSGDVVI